MKESIRHKLESVRDRFEELAGLLADPEVIGDQNQFRDLSKEYSRVEPIVKLFSDYQAIVADIGAAEEMAADKDEDVRQMGEEELAVLQERHDELELELQKALIPPDPHDASNVYLEIRAGTGGDEAAISGAFSMASGVSIIAQIAVLSLRPASSRTARCCA